MVLSNKASILEWNIYCQIGWFVKCKFVTSRPKRKYIDHSDNIYIYMFSWRSHYYDEDGHSTSPNIINKIFILRTSKSIWGPCKAWMKPDRGVLKLIKYKSDVIWYINEVSISKHQSFLNVLGIQCESSVITQSSRHKNYRSIKTIRIIFRVRFVCFGKYVNKMPFKMTYPTTCRYNCNSHSNFGLCKCVRLSLLLRKFLNREWN